MTEEQILKEVFEVLKQHYPYVIDFLFAKIPAAKVILAGPSAAEAKLKELEKKEDSGG